MTDEPGILILRSRIDTADLRRLVKLYFGDMVKYVVDIERGIAAIGGELHADAELVLLEDGSRQGDLWGANYLPGRGPGRCIEYTSLINVRPAQGHTGMEIDDPEIRDAVRRITLALIGEGGEV
jgi:hypothetical protein